MKRIIIGCIKTISLLFRKKNQVLIASSDGYRGNARALAEYIQSQTDWSVLWIAVNTRSADSLSAANMAYDKVYSVSFWLKIFTSRWLVSTHGELGRFKTFRGQYFINLWHGIMLKNLGYMWSPEEGSRTDGVCNIADITATNSPFVSGLFALCFNMPLSTMNITGSPRNDWLLDAQRASERLTVVLGRKCARSILYCPTHRKAEGKGFAAESSWNYGSFKEKYLTPDFYEYLEEQDALFVVKLHPFEESNLTLDEIASKKRVVVLTGQMLDEKHIDLYEILAGFDLLITDYSSMYIDYLLTGQPVLFMADDLEEYKKSRGFVFDMYDDLTPGPKVTESHQLLSELKTMLTDTSYYEAERTRVNGLLNSAQAPFCGNIVELMVAQDG